MCSICNRCCSPTRNYQGYVDRWDRTYSNIQKTIQSVGKVLSSMQSPEEIGLSVPIAELKADLEEMQSIQDEIAPILEDHKKGKDLTCSEKLVKSGVVYFLEGGLWVLGIGSAVTSQIGDSFSCDHPVAVWGGLACMMTAGGISKIKERILTRVVKNAEAIGELKSLQEKANIFIPSAESLISILEVFRTSVADKRQMDDSQWHDLLIRLKQIPREYREIKLPDQQRVYVPEQMQALCIGAEHFPKDIMRSQHVEEEVPLEVAQSPRERLRSVVRRIINKQYTGQIHSPLRSENITSPRNLDGFYTGRRSDIFASPRDPDEIRSARRSGIFVSPRDHDEIHSGQSTSVFVERKDFVEVEMESDEK